MILAIEGARRRRNFVAWRLSASGRHSAWWHDSRRRLKPCTQNGYYSEDQCPARKRLQDPEKIKI